MGLVHHPNVVTDGLIGCWDAANRRSYPATGTTWTDIAGSYNSTLENWAGSSFSSEKLGCLDFDGTDAYAQLSMPATTFSGNGTLSIWMKWNGDVSDGIFAVKGASLAGNYYDGEYWGFQKHVSNTSLIRFHTGIGWATIITHGLSDGDWANIVVVYNGSGGSGICYINGVNKGSLSWSAYSTTDGDAHVGHGGYSNAYYDGEIASVQIYNRQLTAAEVLQNYEAMKPRFVPRITKSGLVANWDAGDPKSYNGGTTTWTDTANGYVGTLQNMEAGDFNLSNEGYFDFDGSDEYVNIGHVGFLSEGTIELWMRYDIAPGDSTNYRPWGGNDYFEARHSSAGLGGAISWDISANSIHSVKTSWSTSVWHHQVWTWKYSSTTGSMYFDGELDVTGTIDQDPSALASSNDMYLMRSSSTYAGNINGKLAVFRVYNRALSAAEVLENYQAAKGRFT